jgi:hypothetical protein
VGRTLDVQHRSRVGHQLGQLSTVNAPDFPMIGRDRKEGNRKFPTELLQVGNIPVHHDPSDSRLHSSTGDSRQACSPDRLNYDRVRPGFARRLNDLQQLLALGN